MELLPNDVRQHRFRKSMRGYNTEEVDQFLEHLATALEASLSGRQRAEELAAALEKEMTKFRDQEDALKKAVFTVEQAMSQARETSLAEVESLRRTAEHRAKQVVQEADSERRRLEQDLTFLQQSRQNYIEQLKGFCKAQLQTLENLERPVRAKEAARQALLPKRPQPGQPPPARPVAPETGSAAERIRAWTPERAERPATKPAEASAAPEANAESTVAFPPPLVPDSTGDKN